MTNHSETTGSSGNGDITEGAGPDRASSTACDGPVGEPQVTLRTPAELADALPYLLGYRPEDSIVLVALRDRDGRGRFGGRARLGIPASADDWASAARQLVHGLVTGSERRGARPEQMVAYLCQEPSNGESGRQVMTRLRPLAQKLRVECGALDVPVVEALCISDGRFWSYCCDDETCCPAEGTPMGLPGTSVLAAAATYAGIQVRGTLRELHARLLPRDTSAAVAQEVALDTASMALVARILDEANRAQVARETLDLAERVMRRLAQAPPVAGTAAADLRDDALLEDDEAATLILGLQDRTTRDRAAQWMEGDEAGAALRLWRALARRCVGPYGEHAAAPLTLVGWVAWSIGDELEAREALAMALGADPDYLFARLLHQACNEGLDPESIRRCLRAERGGRQGTAAERPDSDSDAEAGESTARQEGEAGGRQHQRAVAGPAPTEGPHPVPTATAHPAPTEPPLPARTEAPRPGRRRRARSAASADAPRRRARASGSASRADGGRPRTPAGHARPGGTRADRTTGSRTPRKQSVAGRDACAGDERAGRGEAGETGDRG
ncbi:DUF4192 family protein [Streptomyces sp. HMX87]|uniref:DUF4192 domain-containing protein n=1 Tax=Streptomyces sp. HMX87 TaxID=3390849 RepID=UPI003A8AD971